MKIHWRMIVGLLLFFLAILFNQWVVGRFVSPDGVIETASNLVVIWVFQALAVLCAAALLFNKTREIAFGAFTLLLFVVAIELVLRGYFFIMNDLGGRRASKVGYLGWQTAENAHWVRDIDEYGTVRYSTTRDGFRMFGDPATAKKKILVVGDSYTNARTASDGHTYYHYLSDKAESLEVFAYGCDGYGSLQEYMILERYVDIIQPDIVLWQFCSNDLVNNLHALESQSYRHNNQMTRPYLENGRIVWRFPMMDRGWVYNAVQASVLFRLTSLRLDILFAETVGSIEDEFSSSHPLIVQSGKVTDQVMAMAREAAGSSRFAAFCVDQPEWLGSAFADICSRNSIHYIEGVAETIAQADSAGKIVNGTLYDPHWNGAGHELAGRVILDDLVHLGWLKSVTKEPGEG